MGECGAQTNTASSFPSDYLGFLLLAALQLFLRGNENAPELHSRETWPDRDQGVDEGSGSNSLAASTVAKKVNGVMPVTEFDGSEETRDLDENPEATVSLVGLVRVGAGVLLERVLILDEVQVMEKVGLVGDVQRLVEVVGLVFLGGWLQSPRGIVVNLSNQIQIAMAFPATPAVLFGPTWQGKCSFVHQPITPDFNQHSMSIQGCSLLLSSPLVLTWLPFMVTQGEASLQATMQAPREDLHDVVICLS